MDEQQPKLFMMVLGCRPKDRLTEQHDIYFGVAPSLNQLVPDIKSFWKQGQHNLHIDAYRKVSVVNNYRITLVNEKPENNSLKLFFINLGGYQKGLFDELHYKLLAVGETMADAVKVSKQSLFYKHNGFKGAESHIDDKFDVDDIINIQDILSAGIYLKIEQLTEPLPEDDIHLGYFKLNKLDGLS